MKLNKIIEFIEKKLIENELRIVMKQSFYKSKTFSKKKKFYLSYDEIVSLLTLIFTCIVGEIFTRNLKKISEKNVFGTIVRLVNRKCNPHG